MHRRRDRGDSDGSVCDVAIYRRDRACNPCPRVSQRTCGGLVVRSGKCSQDPFHCYVCTVMAALFCLRVYGCCRIRLPIPEHP
ncbi:hypothetical protein HMPREF1861_02369 [Corynebacterium kroppenstedtii]|nr:hypothetical protein HMPREF1861_02369 [Corynebacterium kroppenstedtii]